MTYLLNCALSYAKNIVKNTETASGQALSREGEQESYQGLSC